MDNQAKINYYWNQFVKEGKLNALSKIYFAYYDFLFDYGLRLTKNIQAVEDTIQNMFVNFLNTRERIGEVKNLSGYLVSIFRRTLFKELEAHNKIFRDDTSDNLQFDFFKSVENSEVHDKIKLEKTYDAIKESIRKLSNRQREIIYLKFEKEISYEEISEILKISVDSCYKLLYRAITSIRKETEEILRENTDSTILYLLFYKNLN
ncbi:sigma-70 family RNA polymerase sigma factor [uncultured Sunxiuqinia sp.]|uniref:RNA polymerase sigma factor n=1 Tax=uncultured Sunxiuqinia sp. TaxID=1573825 RepID=UPI002AA6AA58|nr:sigma-70 family RNA polymerase sigma factor [uncultured Sunxiuqinia sp.]